MTLYLLIVAGLALLLLNMGAITLNVDRTLIRPTHGNTAPENAQQLPTMIASVDMTNPGPVAANTVQNNAAGNCQVLPAAAAAGAKGGAAAGGGYVGYNLKAPIRTGEPCRVVCGQIIDGFVGVMPGQAVYVDATSADAGANASGLSHAPNGSPIGVGLTATKIRFW